VQYVSDLHPKFALRLHHVWKYVDMQSVAAENIGEEKRRKKKDRKKKPQDENIMSASATLGGHNNAFSHICAS